MDLIKTVDQELTKKKVPKFRVGDTVKVHFTVREAGKERTQVFEGVVIALRGTELGKTFMVRRISFGVGVEKIFPFYSPLIKKVTITSKGKVRRAKLFYLRKKIGKAAKVKTKKEKVIAEPVEARE